MARWVGCSEYGSYVGDGAGRKMAADGFGAANSSLAMATLIRKGLSYFSRQVTFGLAPYSPPP